VITAADEVETVLAGLAQHGVGRGDLVAITVAPGVGVGLSAGTGEWSAASSDVVARIETALRPRWVWWSSDTAVRLAADGIAAGTCWDLSAVHRLLFGGWPADPGRVWAALHDLALDAIPATGQLDLLADAGEDGGDAHSVTRPDSYLRPEWASGGWARSPDRLARWAATALAAAHLQHRRLRELDVGGDPVATARSESAAELLCTELVAEGLPVDRAGAEQIIASTVGPRPADEDEARRQRRSRDRVVLGHVSGADEVDLRNPAQVKAMLAGIGFDLPDTRSWRLEPFLGAHPVIGPLLDWRKAERVSTTYGYTWLDRHVGSDGRLRGAWSGSDGAAGRMTAQAGLHNLPAELRPAVVAAPGHVLVRADLGQIEPRILALVSKDAALAHASADDDLYAPVAARLSVERSVAKIAVLAAMYGQTSGAAGEALRGMESAYRVAMQYLRTAHDSGSAGRDVRTHGGRLVRMPALPLGLDEAGVRSARASRARFARNAVVQGAAAEFFKMWAVTVRARAAALDAHIVLCLHDELLVHAPEDRGSDVDRLLRDCLEETGRRWQPERVAVRFVADISCVRRWSDAKGA
jgi:DNA polymerase-1